MKSFCFKPTSDSFTFTKNGNFLLLPASPPACVLLWLMVCVGVLTQWLREAPFYTADKVTSSFSPSWAPPLTHDPVQPGVTRGVKGHQPDPMSLVYHGLWLIRLWQYLLLPLKSETRFGHKYSSEWSLQSKLCKLLQLLNASLSVPTPQSNLCFERHTLTCQMNDYF